MSVMKYKDPVTGEWVKAPDLKVVSVVEYTGGSAVGIPADIVAEAERVVSSITPKIAANSVTFIAMSDMHEFGDSDPYAAATVSQYRRANLNAGQGARLIAEKVPLDFFANLGDFAWGEKGKTILQDYVQSIVNARGYTSGIEPFTECFFTPGNHDTGTYGIEQNGTFLSQEVLNGLIGTYRYADITKKKIRVICLNTAEVDGLTVSKNAGTERISGEQLQWFADSLDLSAKSDAADWGIIVLSHHPLDWGNILPAANCLNAYLTGANFSVTHNGVSVSKNFSGKNAAKVICQFHGHVHGFRVDNIRCSVAGSLQPMDVQRIAIPNACYARTNEYGENTNVDSNGIEFGETSSYEKVDNGTGKNTAFCAVTVDLDEQKIYAYCFGAGRDRVISYGGAEIVTYTVTNNLSNASSNGSTVAVHGEPYMATITVNSGYELSGIKVTMGGVDITASAVSGNIIDIESVDGDIVITVTTVQTVVPPSYDNKVTSSINVDGSQYMPPNGYQEGYRLNSSGTTTESSGAVNCGFIPYNGEVVRVWGTTGSNAGNSGNYVAVYDGDFAKINSIGMNNLVSYGGTWIEKDGKYMLTVDPAALNNATAQNNFASAAYIRASMVTCAGADFVVTLDEPIA